MTGADLIDTLRASDRRLLHKMAEAAGASAEAMAAAMVESYLVLVRDAPGALPRDPMAGLGASAKRIATKGGGV